MLKLQESLHFLKSSKIGTAMLIMKIFRLTLLLNIASISTYCLNSLKPSLSLDICISIVTIRLIFLLWKCRLGKLPWEGPKYACMLVRGTGRV